VNDDTVVIFWCSVAVIANVAIWLWKIGRGVNDSGEEVLEEVFLLEVNLSEMSFFIIPD